MSNGTRTTTDVAPKCGCSRPTNRSKRIIGWTTAGGLLAALGVCAACCLLPFTLLSVGIAGAWVSTLDALAPYKWIFIGLTAGLLAYGFYAAYWKPRRACSAGASCEACGTSRPVRVGLWIATVLATGGILFEQLERYLG